MQRTKATCRGGASPALWFLVHTTNKRIVGATNGRPPRCGAGLFAKDVQNLCTPHHSFRSPSQQTGKQ